MFETEIQRGIAWLEETRPGSVVTIDLDRLDLRVPDDCPLGQVFARDAGMHDTGYHWATSMHQALRLPRPNDCCGACRYGFCAPAAKDFPTLTEEWKEALRALQGVSA